MSRTHDLTEQDSALAESDSPGDLHAGNPTDLPDGGSHLDRGELLHSDAQPIENSGSSLCDLLRIGADNDKRTILLQDFAEKGCIFRDLFVSGRLRAVGHG